MSKKFKFKTTKQTLSVDKKAISILKSYQEAVHLCYKNQPETTIDLENALFNNLKKEITLSEDDIASVVADLHGLNKSEILELKKDNGWYINSKSSVFLGVCGMLARVTGWNANIFRALFIFAYAFSIGLWVYLILAIIAPTKEEKLTQLFINTLNEQNSEPTVQDLRPKWKQKLGQIFDVFSAGITRIISLIIMFVAALISLVYTYYAGGLILHKLGFWPDVLFIQTTAYNLDNLIFIPLVIIDFSAVLLSAYILIKMMNIIRLNTSIDTKLFSKFIGALALLALINIGTQSILDTQPETMSQKSFGLEKMSQLTFNNNSICPASYNVLIQKSTQNSILISGESNKVSSLTVDSLESNKYNLTSIYPLQMCLKLEKPTIAVVINSTNSFDIESVQFNDYKVSITVLGFKKGEIKIPSHLEKQAVFVE